MKYFAIYRLLFSALVSLIVGSEAKCFQNRNELAKAVGGYLKDNSPNTPVARSYGQPIGKWCVSEVTDFSEIFMNATDFNEDISEWDTSSANSMRSMFSMARSFNQPLSSWNVANVEDMEYMFLGALSFDQDISSWDVSKVSTMRSTFFGAAKFNGDISSWNVANCLDMSGLFFGAKSFNRDVSGWQVSEETKLSDIFLDAWSFKQDLCPWGSKIKNEAGKHLFQGTKCPLHDDPDWTQPSAGPFCFECATVSLTQGMTHRASSETPSMSLYRMTLFKLFGFVFAMLLALGVRYLGVFNSHDGIDPSDQRLTEFELLQNMSDGV